MTAEQSAGKTAQIQKEQPTRVRITWNGMGGELDSVTVSFTDDGNDMALTRALVKLIQGNIVSPGDSFTVERIT